MQLQRWCSLRWVCFRLLRRGDGELCTTICHNSHEPATAHSVDEVQASASGYFKRGVPAKPPTSQRHVPRRAAAAAQHKYQPQHVVPAFKRRAGRPLLRLPFPPAPTTTPPAAAVQHAPPPLLCPPAPVRIALMPEKVIITLLLPATPRRLCRLAHDRGNLQHAGARALISRHRLTRRATAVAMLGRQLLALRQRPPIHCRLRRQRCSRAAPRMATAANKSTLRHTPRVLRVLACADHCAARRGACAAHSRSMGI